MRSSLNSDTKFKMPPKKGASKKAPAFVSQRPPFEYTAIRPEEYDRVITLTVKLVSWSYLNFVVRVPLSTSLAAIKDMIRHQHRGAISTTCLLPSSGGPRISDLGTPVSGLTDYDRQSISKCLNKDIRLYKGSPLTFPPLPSDDLLTLQDIGFVGATPDEPQVEADLFYDFTSAVILGKGKQKF